MSIWGQEHFWQRLSPLNYCKWHWLFIAPCDLPAKACEHQVRDTKVPVRTFSPIETLNFCATFCKLEILGYKNSASFQTQPRKQMGLPIPQRISGWWRESSDTSTTFSLQSHGSIETHLPHLRQDSDWFSRNIETSHTRLEQVNLDDILSGKQQKSQVIKYTAVSF